MVALVLLAAACSDDGSSADATVTFRDDEVVISEDALDEGAISFDVDNVGREEHELVIVAASAGEVGALQPRPDGTVDLAALKRIDRAGPFKPGLYRTGVPNLNAGSYVLLCNLPGHFERGIWAAFDVEADNVPSPTPAPDDAGHRPMAPQSTALGSRRTTT